MPATDRKRHHRDSGSASRRRPDGGRSVPTGNPDVDNGELKTGTVPGQPLPVTHSDAPALESQHPLPDETPFPAPPPGRKPR